MESSFLEKCQSYCTISDRKEELFKIRKNEDESLEDYLDRFIFLSKWCGGEVISLDILKTLFLKGLDDKAWRSLDLIGKGDMSQLGLDDITELCQNFSHTWGGIQNSTFFKGSNEIGKLREEIANLKTGILVQLNTMLDGI